MVPEMLLEGLKLANEAYGDYRRGRAVRLGMYNNEPRLLGVYKNKNNRQLGNYYNY